ncbi:MAG: DUF1048 domain-containing protein [Oscillospiraceae bacterium]|jgi:DNA-binding ferritin-like protein (Dps family)|nr:DUF1048 domain-containing protein [Oscillospiraceae bacterium]
MSDFFDNYLNVRKILKSKREYKAQMARVEAMPSDYRYVFKEIQKHTWMFAAGDGLDMLKIHYDLIELFESGVAEGKGVLEITGSDVAGFCEDLLRNAKTYTEDWRIKLNRDIAEKLGKGETR